MSIRFWSRLMCALLIGASPQLSSGQGNRATGQPGDIADGSGGRPNVLMIAIDDLNDWIEALGVQPGAYTPNINRLIERGTLFTNAHCQAPLCGPSRASLLTGLRPSTTGIYGMIKDDSIRNANAATRKSIFLPEYFKRFGYKTMGAGKIFHERPPEGVFDLKAEPSRVGFGPRPKARFHWDKRGTSTDWGAFPERDEDMPDHKSAQWAIERLQEEHDRPFFLAVGFLRPHVPWYVPKKWFELAAGRGVKPPPYLENDMDDVPAIARRLTEMDMMPSTEWALENGQWQNICEAYVACVAFVDHYVGEILKALDKSPHKDNTIIVLWSDHGYHLGEKNRFAKSSIWDRSTRIPLVIAGPSLPEGQRSSRQVELLDIYPTLVDLCGLPQNRQLEGHSLKKLLHNPDARWPHPAISTYARNNHSIRMGDLRYIVYEDGSEELYDHSTDPNEWKNLAGDPGYRRRKETMKKFIPKVNAPWAAASSYDYNEYLTRQKRDSF